MAAERFATRVRCGRVAQSQSSSARELPRTDMEARQRALWNLERVKRKLSENRRAPEQRLAYRQIREDFEQLQLTNYHLAGFFVEKGAVDYRQIRRDAAEVRKRAARLRANLLLPEAAKDEKPAKEETELAAAELKPIVGTLDALVQRFVWNPIFQHPDVLDMEQSVRARLDLEKIIRLSEHIQKRADALSKAVALSKE